MTLSIDDYQIAAYLCHIERALSATHECELLNRGISVLVDDDTTIIKCCNYCVNDVWIHVATKSQRLTVELHLKLNIVYEYGTLNAVV